VGFFCSLDLEVLASALVSRAVFAKVKGVDPCAISGATKKNFKTNCCDHFLNLIHFSPFFSFEKSTYSTGKTKSVKKIVAVNKPPTTTVAKRP